MFVALRELRLLALAVAGVLAAVAISASAAEPASPAADSALAIFQRRIAPILQAKEPTSCSECHLGGVDLKQYIRADQAATFAALRDAGLIDVERPDASKLLAFISRTPDKPSLVGQKARAEELAAFQAWIRAAVRDPKLLAAKTDLALGPDLPPAVIAHARQDRVLGSFVENVWSEVGRCAACHSPDRNQKQVEKHGEQVSWIRLRDPNATLKHLIDQGLINPKQPEASLLLKKPTLQVEHGGGQKMLVGDRTYRQFRRFLDDYAAIRSGKYHAAADLPRPAAEVSHVTDIWFKLTDVPSEFDKLLLQVDLYRWDEAAGRWSAERWATADRAVFGKGRLWQQHLSVVAPRNAARAKSWGETPSLPPGKYLARISVDRDNRLAREPAFHLGPNELFGEVEITSRWPAGYGQMTVARCPERKAK